jgi:hypothetical protein
VDNLVLQRVAQVLKHIHGRGLRMFTHGNGSGGILMKFSAPNILGFRLSDWEAVKKYGTLFKTDGSVNTSKWRRLVDGVNISIETDRWHKLTFISFTSTDSDYSTPDDSTYGSFLTTD